jgi:hypothetical protein
MLLFHQAYQATYSVDFSTTEYSVASCLAAEQSA